MHTDQSVLRIGLENTGEKIENRIKVTIKGQGEKCRVVSQIVVKKHERKMAITSVENRLKAIKKMQRESSQKSRASFTVQGCNTSLDSKTSSASSKKRNSSHFTLQPSSKKWVYILCSFCQQVTCDLSNIFGRDNLVH